IITPEPESFTRYDALFDAGNGRIYARKESLAYAPALVEISPGRKESRIIPLPRGGRVSMAEMYDEDNNHPFLRIAWNSIRNHPVYTGASVSDISIVDIDSNNKVIRRKNIINGSRLLYPALSPDGTKLACVDLLDNGFGALVVLDTLTGKELERFDFQGNIPETPAYPSWSPDSEKLVFSLRNNKGRRIAEWRISGSVISHLSEEAYFTVKNPIYSADGSQVIFSSNESGLEALWSISLNNTGTIPSRHLAAQRWYGVYKPAAPHITSRGNIIYAVEYSSNLGEVITQIELLEGNTPQAPRAAGAVLIPIETLPREPEFTQSNYNPAKHTLNVHSWGLSFLAERNELHMGISSRDILGTMSFETGALYEITETSPGAYANLFYTGIRPVIGVHGEYRYRSPENNPFHQSSFSVSALYPANLSRTGIWNHKLDIGISAGLLSYYSARGTASDHLPHLSYQAEWSR
ncbi:MAG: PD40 domain-containing protein, partial [Spirochaetaceae bacterium]|nr:PD40 domain-containing protein [Spirochaetaceae bacterium]